MSFARDPQSEPVTVADITCEVRNIHNRPEREGEFPNGLLLEAALPGSGRVRVTGAADFLREPLPAVKADLELRGLDLARFKQLAQAYHLDVRKGTVSGAAAVEFTPDRRVFVLKDLTLQDAAIDYFFYETALPEEARKEKKAKAAAKAGKLQKDLVNKPGLLVKADRMRITGSNFGIVNKSAKPAYRVYLNDTGLELRNFSNQFSEGPASLYLKGNFMGSGETVASGTFRPETQGPDFNIRIAIKETQMAAMNDLFRAYGKFDVSSGLFSFYSELAVKNNKVTGYVKPLFRDLKVYDKRTDSEKSEFRKLYEEMVGGVARLLENRPRGAVATETPVSGSPGEPKTSTWAALGNLLRNAFFQAILPGFEKNLGKEAGER